MSIPRCTTPRVIAAVFFCLAVVLLFQHTPQALRWPVRLLGLFAVVWLILSAIQSLLTSRFKGKKLLFSLIIGMFLYVAVYGMCHLFIQFMARRDDRLALHEFKSLPPEGRATIEAMLNAGSYNLFDPDIGWVPRPEFHSEMYNISRQGLRSLREYPMTPPDPAKRILCLGDSFTFGYAVGDRETYPYDGEQLRPDTEWLNLGISGSCLTQSLMQYRKNGKRFGGKHVVIGFMTQDAQRTVNCFRPFVSPAVAGATPLTKPFAKFSGDRFSIEPNPFQSTDDYRRLLANEGPEIERLRMIDYVTWSNQSATSNPILRTADYVSELMRLDQNIDQILSRPSVKAKPTKNPGNVDPYGRLGIWNASSLGFQAITRLFDLYYQEIIADGREPLIVIIPGPLDVEDFTREFPRQYTPLVNHFKAKGMRHLDFLDPLTLKHKNDLSMNAIFVDYHYNGIVNKELAEEIIKVLGLP